MWHQHQVLTEADAWSMCTHMTQCKWTASEMRLTLSAVENAMWQ
jgi:hypothetical protein